jgi:predicted DNA-binding transcriptional regulator AlpA
MAKRLIRLNEGIELLGVSRSEYYRRQKSDPGFPKIIKGLGKGTKASHLDSDEIEVYQAARIAERDEAVLKAATQRARDEADEAAIAFLKALGVKVTQRDDGGMTEDHPTSRDAIERLSAILGGRHAVLCGELQSGKTSPTALLKLIRALDEAAT